MIVLIFALLLVACGGAEVESDFVARLGTETLTQDELSRALFGLTLQMDSTDAANQVVEQWMTNELLVAEARRRGIDGEAAVRADLLKAESSVLVGALLEQVYERSEDAPTESEVQAYFERNREQFRLAVPWVQVRYLVMNNRASSDSARTTMAALPVSDPQGWDSLAQFRSMDPDLSVSLARSLVPEARAFSGLPDVAGALAGLTAGETSAVISELSRFHVVQLVLRVPTGTLPQRSWIEESLLLRLQIESRKLLYARLVQRLRNEALAREQLELPVPAGG